MPKFSLRLSDEVHLALTQKSKELDRSINDLVTDAIVASLNLPIPLAPFLLSEKNQKIFIREFTVQVLPKLEQRIAEGILMNQLVKAQCLIDRVLSNLHPCGDTMSDTIPDTIPNPMPDTIPDTIPDTNVELHGCTDTISDTIPDTIVDPSYELYLYNKEISDKMNQLVTESDFMNKSGSDTIQDPDLLLDAEMRRFTTKELGDRLGVTHKFLTENRKKLSPQEFFSMTQDLDPDKLGWFWFKRAFLGKLVLR